MRFNCRDAVIEDLPRIVDIYNLAVATRESSCDLEPISVSARERWFATHSGSRRPIWVAEDRDAPERGVIGYLGFYYFMNERPGYFITADLAIYLHPDYQGKRLGTYLLREAIREAPSLGIEVLAVTIFGSNQASIRLFERHGFERWGFMPRVARLGDIERDLVMMGRRLDEPPARETEESNLMEYIVRLEQVGSRPLAVVRRRAKQQDLSKVVPDACGTVWNVIRSQQVPGAGRHVAVYLDNQINLEVGVELEAPFVGHGEVVGSSTPAGLVATTTHYGPYGLMHNAHQAILKWCSINGHTLAGPSWEIYGHWVDAWNSDPSKITTEIYYLLSGEHA